MRLYLQLNGAWQLMKMDAGTDISLNFAHDNLENPSNYVSEFSYQLKVPVCAENNRLLSEFIRLDSLVVSGGYTPTKSIPYMVMDNAGALISTGNAYIKTISGGYYNFSLAGSMSRIFQKLLNSGWSSSNTDREYTRMTDWLSYRKSSTTFTEELNCINKDVVFASWLIDSPLFDWDTLKNTILRNAYHIGSVNATETFCWIASIVGFVPTAQGTLPSFSGDKWLEIGNIGEYAGDTFVILPVLCSSRNEDNEPVETYEAKDGLVEAQMGEYRSYYQQPFIYVFRLWQMYQVDFSTITGGYSLILDDRWFNESNPRLANMVYMLPKLFDEGINETLSTESMEDSSVTKTLPAATAQTSESTFLVEGVSNISTIPQYVFKRNKRGDMITYDFHVKVTVTPNQTIPGSATLYASPFNIVLVSVLIQDDANYYHGFPAVMASRKYAMVFLPDDGSVTIDTILSDPVSKSQYVLTMQQGYELIQVTYTPGDATYEFEFDDTMNAVNNRSAFIADTKESRSRLSAWVSYSSNNTPWMYVDSGTTTYSYNGQSTVELELSNVSVKKSYASRTGKVLSLGTLFRDEKPFSVLLKYSKMMHLVWKVDDNAKTVTVLRSSDFYGDIAASNAIVNLTDKVDLSRGVDITPLSWTDNRVQLNFKGTDLDYIKDYEENYGLAYGSKMVITTNEINASTKKLLCNNENDTIETAALLSEKVFPIGQLEKSMNTQEFVENDPMMLNKSGGASADHHGCFMYRLTNGTWNPRISAGWRDEGGGDSFVYITDDNDQEYNLSEWTWHGPAALSSDVAASWVKCYERPRLDTTSPDGSSSVYFASPREVFTDWYRQPTTYLYDAVWKDYIEEVYNLQNKTVSLYAAVDKALFDKLKQVPLVQIENVLYLLSKVEGWGEHAAVCKLTLRQVYDLSKLTGGVPLEPPVCYVLTEAGEYLQTENNESIITES